MPGDGRHAVIERREAGVPDNTDRGLPVAVADTGLPNRPTDRLPNGEARSFGLEQVVPRVRLLEGVAALATCRPGVVPASDSHDGDAAAMAAAASTAWRSGVGAALGDAKEAQFWLFGVCPRRRTTERGVACAVAGTLWGVVCFGSGSPAGSGVPSTPGAAAGDALDGRGFDA